jgi:hypothetical protein
MQLSRRGFITTAPGACTLASLLLAGTAGSTASATHAAQPGENISKDGALWPDFPRQNPERIREMVGVCHRDVDRVRALLDESPALVNATWDWGFGDWETALGAAAHTGRRNIAELLLERGARLDVFAAAMLGQTDVVKAMILASPGIQRNPGPHGITLLAHARSGGDAAAQTLTYLEGLGDADMRPAAQPLTDEQRQACLGRFTSPALGDGAIEVKSTKAGDITITFKDQFPLILRHAGDCTFYPAGAPAVKIKFLGSPAGRNTLEVTDHTTLLIATRST